MMFRVQVDSWLHVLRLYSSAFAADDKASDEYKFNEYKFNQQTGSFEPPQWSRQCQRLLEHIVQHPHSEPFRLPLNWYILHSVTYDSVPGARLAWTITAITCLTPWIWPRCR